MREELSTEESEQVVTLLKMLWGPLMLLNNNLELIKRAEKHLKEGLSEYESLWGLSEPFQYEAKIAKRKAELKRLSAIICMIEVFQETNEIIEARS